MNRTENKEVAVQLQDLPNFVLRMMVEHPNQCAELAANELLVRKIRMDKNAVSSGYSIKA